MGSRLQAGWRGVALIAAVYVYFLIFAQFAFLTRLAQLGLAAESLKIVMAAMAAAGILFSLLTPRLAIVRDPATRLRTGLGISAAAAVLSLAPLTTAAAAVVASLIGAGLGITTVTLVTHLRAWTGERRGILFVGLGTGIAYFVCNVPAVFTATPQEQALLAAALCAAAMLMPLAPSREARASRIPPHRRMALGIALASFAALIWLDSAAFYIIQHAPSLKAETWLGSTHLWANGVLHFSGALLAAFLLENGATRATLALAFGALGFACVLLQNPATLLSAPLFYPVGVSLYSVALVAYPSFLSRAESAEHRGRQAGWIYAIAGWIGSALGIGMAQNLGRVPIAFVAVAGVVVLAPVCLTLVKHRTREVALVGITAAVAFAVFELLPKPVAHAALTPAERGRQVYISEGCISCHSQYVRPNSPDVLMWGPVESLASIHAQKPPLIGNRRQGPDLSEVGLRRSPLWLKAHIIRPAQVSYHSPMPSFAFLFRDERGNDLVAYLASLHAPNEAPQFALQAAWRPSAAQWNHPDLREGERVFQEHCATCHADGGATRMRWLNAWRKVPQDTAAFRAHAQAMPPDQLARIAKFGIPGTDMPGHEYLADAQIVSVAAWLKSPSQFHSSTH